LIAKRFEYCCKITKNIRENINDRQKKYIETALLLVGNELVARCEQPLSCFLSASLRQ